MKGIRIVSTGKALPKRRITNDDLSLVMDTSDEWISSRTGIKSRYHCDAESGETCTQLAILAAKAAIQRAAEKEGEDFDCSKIGVLLAATSTPDTIFPSVACMIQRELGLPETIAAFDISAACSGFLMGIGTARGLLESISLQNPGKQYALVVGCEALSRIVDQTDRSTCILFGDGAGAAVIALSDSAYEQKFWCRGNEEALHCFGPGHGDAKLGMKGNDVFKFAVTALAQGIEELLQDQQLTMDDIDYCICHQANARIIGYVMKKYPGQEHKFYMNIAEYGNTSAASIPIALDEMMETRKLQTGMKILCVAFGAGLTWTGIYLEI